MPTLEERIEAIQHAISIMQTEHTSDIKQLYDRVNALQQQVTEQRNRLAEHGQGIQGIQQRSDGLITLLSQQFKNIDTHFVKVDQQFEKIDQHAAKTDQRMSTIEKGLDETTLYATRTYGIVEFQQADIRVLKEDVGIIKEDVSGIKGRLDQIDQRFVSLEGKFDQRFTSLEGKFDQMLQLLTKGQKS